MVIKDNRGVQDEYFFLGGLSFSIDYSLVYSNVTEERPSGTGYFIKI